MDLRKLKTLIDLVSDSNISELEITEAEGKVRIVKSGLVPATQAQLVAAPAAEAAPAPPPTAAALAATAAAAAAATEAIARSTDKIIKSPMVGTFYRAASPGGKPLVDVGDSIKNAQAVCIIEAMKIMNEIESDCEGKVLRVLCENGQAVEFGQPLFVVE
jgi:acetyl-CoA carboxylase biotin carboxyl carrier protein